ncbi:MAG: TIGR04283 family arsenosugar biosynthesis glycosyltransferase [Alphaproteobacteria bacterium]|nr:TIGR04283 family arsenosugar biosynthesis glycosyltransferase [Alphaproteobacteria bacterium]
MLSIVIPTLNAADELVRTLDSLGRPPWAGIDGEIVVADGGSRDASPAVARAAGARLVTVPRGRGAQLAAGAEAARGDWLLFLHADTRLGAGWARAARAFMEDPRHAARAAVFGFALDDDAPAARRLERMVAWRTRHLGLPYGDQGLLIGRAFYRRLGGFRPIPLMEDVDLVRRLGRGRIDLLPVAAVTSASRWRRDGWTARSARNLFCLGLYFLGVPPRLIARVYR